MFLTVIKNRNSNYEINKCMTNADINSKIVDTNQNNKIIKPNANSLCPKRGEVKYSSFFLQLDFGRITKITLSSQVLNFQILYKHSFTCDRNLTPDFQYATEESVCCAKDQLQDFIKQ